MVYSAILIASVFLLLAFAVERFSPLLGIPSVIVLVVLGFVAKPLMGLLGYALVGLDVTVPIIGTIGLVLIVLEGALDIKLRRDRIRLAVTAFSTALIGFVVGVVIFSTTLYLGLSVSAVDALLLSVPFAVISSAVAISSSQFLPEEGREFVVYESSISDILGVLVFFAVLNSGGTLQGALLGLIGGSTLSLVLSVVCSVGLVLVLMRIEGHIRFVPLLAGLFLLYSAGELMHLSPLIMVLMFGLVLNNSKLLMRVGHLKHWVDDSFEDTLSEFKVLVLELTFAVRGFFFILLGYWTELSDLLAYQAWLAAAVVLAVIYGARYVLFKLNRQPDGQSLQWIAPRGLITVLLFLTAKEKLDLPSYLDGTVLIVVLASTALVTLARLRLAQQKSPADDAMQATP